jgi:hypothetical protein
MLNHTNESGTPHHPTTHVLGFMQHALITLEVWSWIHREKNYIVTEYSANGQGIRTLHSGRDIQKNYSQIFGNYIHAFVVDEQDEDGWVGKRVFAYTGPIPDKVTHILSPQILH